MPHLFLAAGHNGTRLTSPDGKAWSPPMIGKEGETYRAAAAGNGRFVAIGSYGSGNIFATTADGQTWKTSFQDGKYSRYLRGIGFGNGIFLGVGGDPGSVGSGSPFVYTSPDGEKWDGPHDAPGKFIIRRVAFGNRRFVGVGDRGRRATSPDGRKWTDAPDAKAIDTLVDVAFGNGTFVGVGLHGLRIRTADGLKWTDRQTGEEGEHLNAVVWAGDRFVAVGAGVTAVSRDGLKWERIPNTNAPLTVAHGNGVFVGPRWKGKLVRSTDGIKWDETHAIEHHIEAVTYGEVAAS
ncbi:WD40/YVTN/BNR-like repeat-containing protein [Fimbriiglobus ruber]|uniref:BNR repeat domain protein n=1 Tax=Fimbriiglobus ruber TaxID=1908690 RepID=A0A225DVI7_9BACT|nr:hypothetical protein [Fimbriiglobus ruber]OWK43624.1 hypothetical protein FRUB_03223 [Fimbriiglobus ruber]